MFFRTFRGSIIHSLYGLTVPEPFPLYPGSMIYGSQRVPEFSTKKLKSAWILLGTYDDWEKVVTYYHTKWSVMIEDEYKSPGASYHSFRAEKPGGDRVTVFVESDKRGLSRDLSKWIEEAENPDKANITVGGDPKEVMINVIIRWSNSKPNTSEVEASLLPH